MLVRAYTEPKVTKNTEDGRVSCRYGIKSLFLQPVGEITELVVNNMCRYNMSFDDAIVNKVLPHFKDEQSLLKWMQVSMEHLMLEYAAQFKSPAVDGKLNALPNTSESFLQLGGILGRQRKSFSWEELREDAYSDKYGI